MPPHRQSRGGSALADEVRGSHYTRMEALGHFPMCENPEAFKRYLLPVLEDVRRRSEVSA